MVSENTANEVFSKIRADNANNTCADCGSDSTSFVSVSHGIFICESCAVIHQSLGPNISFIKSLRDSWSIRQLKLMTVGGNTTLKTFFAKYNMPESATIRFKYHTLAAKYYREMLKVMAEGEPCTMKTPSVDEGLSLIVDPSLVYAEVQVKKKEEKKSESFMMNFLNTALSTTVGAGKNLFEKVKENEGFRDLENRAIKAAHIVGEGIMKGAQIGVEKLENTGVSFGKQGVNFLRSGALSAFDAMTKAAANSYEAISMDERTRRIKEESMSFLNSLEIRNHGNKNSEFIEDNDI